MQYLAWTKSVSSTWWPETLSRSFGNTGVTIYSR